MNLDPYTAAVLRDSVARVAWLLPHDIRRSLLLRARPGQRDLYTTMRAHELGEIAGQGVSLVGFDRHKCIFVHIPKCGGISIGRSLFGSYEGNHMGIPTYQTIYSKADFDEYFKFSFVRNPWDRLLSAYQFMRQGGDRNPDGAGATAMAPGERPDTSANLAIKMRTRTEVLRFDDFEAFVTGWINSKNARVFEHFRPQHKFVCSPNGKLQLDFVGRLENIDDDLQTIGKRLGIELDVVHHNRTLGTRPSYRDAYTPATRKIVADVYARDIEMFGYSFDDG